MNQAIAVLVGALLGGLLSVLSSWVAQHVQIRGQWLSEEVRRRQDLYTEFIEAAAHCYGDALRRDQPAWDLLAKVYGAMGRMRLQSSDLVMDEAGRITRKILTTYREGNWSADQIRDFLAEHSVELFADFARACRIELMGLQRQGLGQAWLS